MGRLAGFKDAKVAKKLARLGFQFDRSCKGGHEYWVNEQTGKLVLFSRHPGKDVREGTLREMLRQMGVSIERFLSA